VSLFPPLSVLFAFSAFSYAFFDFSAVFCGRWLVCAPDRVSVSGVDWIFQNNKESTPIVLN
jgi:hypothetical protein